MAFNSNSAPVSRLAPNELYGEVPGGRDIYPAFDDPEGNLCAPVWTLVESDGVTVKAAPMSHSVPCVGYVVKEADKPGRLRREVAMPVIERNFAVLKENSVRDPMKMMSALAKLKDGESLRFPDGTLLTKEDVQDEERMGRKVVILGDTCDAGALENLAKDCDLLVHEATNAFVPEYERSGDYSDLERDTVKHGHSTPVLAGAFAKRVGAKRLALNHFSSRYAGDSSELAVRQMRVIEEQALKASGLDEDKVVAAWDHLQFPIPPP